MKTLIIRKKSEPEKRVEIRTDLMGDGGMFTVMTINGKIEGYTITIKGEKDQTLINVLDKDIFDESIHNFVLSFISFII